MAATRVRFLAQSFGRRLYSSNTIRAQLPEEIAEEQLAGKTSGLWKKISFFVAIPSIFLSIANAYAIDAEKEEHSEYIPFGTYMSMRINRFPWGDGNHSLFHNPHANHVPE